MEASKPDRVLHSKIARICNDDGIPVLMLESTNNGILITPLVHPGPSFYVSDGDLREALDGLR